jgi:hypothetical protein
VAFKIPYAHDYITKLCRIQAEVILNHANPIADATEHEAMQRKYERIKAGGDTVLQWLNKLRHKPALTNGVQSPQ